MKLVLSLPHSIRAFEPQAEQLARWRARYPQHQLVVALEEADFLQQLADADGALVWRFVAAWYDHAPRLRFVATPAAGREKVQPDPSGRVRAIHGSFHGKIMAESLLAMLLFTPVGIWLWQTPTLVQFGLLFLAALLGTVAYLLTTEALRLAEISAIQPMNYLGIVWAGLFDWIVFANSADIWTFVGAAIVIGSTSFIAHREAKLSRAGAAG